VSRIGALRLGFSGIAIFAACGLMRDWIAQLFVSGYDYRFVGLAQTIGFLIGCYGFYRFMALGENR
jgi:hypothetical protein